MDRGLSVSGECFQLLKSTAGVCSGVDDLPQECRFSWYWNKKEIENNSPSRKDGVDLRKESQLRKLYCSFLQDIGMRLGVPQVTIATAMMLCHRFYLHQSHAKNEWQTIATVCMFLASKVEDTPCHLDNVVKVAYEMMYQRDPAAAQRIHQKDVFEKQKALILIGERLLLCTIRFDFNIQHPYKPLHEAFRKLQITQKDVRQTAWNFVNDWLRTSLCLQYKPNYIAAGSLYLAAKHHNVKLPSGSGYVWWQAFNVMAHQLDVVVQQMTELLGYKRRPVVTSAAEKPKIVESPIVSVVKEEASSSPDSCVLSRDGSLSESPSCAVNQEASAARPMDFNNQSSNSQNANTEDRCELRDLESPNGVVEDCQEISKGIDQARTEPDQIQAEGALKKINVERIKALMKTRKRSRESNNKSMKAEDETSEEAWIERELEGRTEADRVDALKKINVERIKALMKMRKRTTENNDKCTNPMDETSEDVWIERELEAGLELAAGCSTKRQRPREIL